MPRTTPIMVFRRFGSARGGNTAMLFALLIIPLVLAAGIAIDFSRSGQAASLAQESADAALLRAARAKTANPDLSDADLTALARKIFDGAMKNAAGVTIQTFTVTFDDATDSFVLELSGGVATSLMKAAGIDSIPLKTVSAVQLGDPPYMEIVLALDVTGSMNDDGKLSDMKESASELVEAVFSDPQAEVKMGVIPFAQYANVGTGMSGESWLDEGGGWGGCVGSRVYPANLVDGDYAAKPIPGVSGVDCPDAILPLSDDKDAILDKIDGLDADGWTYIPAGLAWGWRVLSSHAPFTGGLSPEALADRAGSKSLVLLTDGANTRAPDYPTHESADKALADSIMTELCDNVKTDGVVIYTIAFDITDANIHDLLEDCATTPGYYYDADTDVELAAAFRSIASSLRTLSLSK